MKIYEQEKILIGILQLVYLF